MLKPSKTSYGLIQANEMKSRTNIRKESVYQFHSEWYCWNEFHFPYDVSRKKCTLLCTAVASQQKMMSVADDKGWRHVILWF